MCSFFHVKRKKEQGLCGVIYLFVIIISKKYIHSIHISLITCLQTTNAKLGE